ncbi:Fimbrial protein [compost metagenome]
MRILAFLLFLLVSPSIFAAGCKFENGYSTSEYALALPASITIPRNATNGAVLWDSQWQQASTPHVTCSSTGTVSGALASGIGAPVPGYTSNGFSSVFQTNIPGIGISVFWCNEPNASCDPDLAKNTPLPNLAIPVKVKTYTPPNYWRVRLIKTGNIDASAGVLSASGVSTITYIDIPEARLTLTGGTAVTGLGCEVNADSRNIDVRLPTIAKTDFVGGPVVQASDKARTFAINLLCDPGVKVAYQVDGYDAPTDVLANASGPGMATGVGVRLYRGDVNSSDTLFLGVKFQYVQTSGATQGVSIPLTARYYRTAANSSDMTSGLVSTTATFTLFYE